MEKTINDIIEDIQEANIQAGGRFQRSTEIKQMTVEGLLTLLLPNDITFNVKYNA